MPSLCFLRQGKWTMKGKCIKTSLPSKVKYHGHLVPCPGDDSSLKGPKSFTVKNHSKSADSFDLVCFFLSLPCLWSLSFPVLQNCTIMPAMNMIGINENTTQVYQQCGKSDLSWWPTCIRSIKKPTLILWNLNVKRLLLHHHGDEIITCKCGKWVPDNI